MLWIVAQRIVYAIVLADLGELQAEPKTWSGNEDRSPE